MCIVRLYITLLSLAMIPIEASSRDGKAIWDSRCEECHGNPEKFATKYLWNVEGQLQGQHHTEDFNVFMRNHYTPDHEIETINNMLLAQANSLARYDTECAECHGEAKQYVKKSFWVGNTGITAIESGEDVAEFLANHRDLGPEDVTFYLILFSRVAGNPLSFFTPIPALR